MLEDPRAVVVPLEVVVDWWRCWPGALPLWPCEVVVVVARGGLAEGDELGGVGGAVAVGAWLPVATGWPCPPGWALDAAGLDLVHWRGYLSHQAMWLFDLSHYYGAPTLLSKRLFGRWVLWPDKVRYWPPERWLAQRLVRYGEEDPGLDGAYLFLVCKKR